MFGEPELLLLTIVVYICLSGVKVSWWWIQQAAAFSVPTVAGPPLVATTDPLQTVLFSYQSVSQ